MKKNLFLLMAFAVLSLTIVKAQQRPNIYAYNLSVKTPFSQATHQVTVAYYLNTDAKSVEFTVNGCQVKKIGTEGKLGPNPSSGVLVENTATLELISFPGEGGSLEWTVIPTGWAATDPDPEHVYGMPAMPAKGALLKGVALGGRITTINGTTNQLSGNEAQFGFNFPRGVAADNNPKTSLQFGKVYVTESLGATLTAGGMSGRTTKQGIYALDQRLTQANEFSIAAGAGFSSVYDESPGRITVAEDGRIVISDNTPTHSGVWLMNQIDGTLTEVFGGIRVNNGTNNNLRGPRYGTRVTGTAIPAWNDTNAKRIHGIIQQAWLQGTGTAATLYTMDVGFGRFLPYMSTRPDSAYIGSKTFPVYVYEGHKNIFQYNIGETGAPKPWNTMPSGNTFAAVPAYQWDIPAGSTQNPLPAGTSPGHYGPLSFPNSISGDYYLQASLFSHAKVHTMVPRNGGWWIAQPSEGRVNTVAKGPRSCVLFIKKTTASPVDQNSRPVTVYASNQYTATGDPVINCSGVIAVSPDGTLLAVPQYYGPTPDPGSTTIATTDTIAASDTPRAPFHSYRYGNNFIDIYEICYAADGVTPNNLKRLYCIDNGSSGSPLTPHHVNAVEFDWANNLYVISNQDERLKVYALAKTGGINRSETPVYNLDDSRKIVIPRYDPSLANPANKIGGNNTRADGATTRQDFFVTNKTCEGIYFNSMESACNAFNMADIVGNVRLWINGNLPAESKNVGLVNPTNYSITVSSDINGETPGVSTAGIIASSNDATPFLKCGEAAPVIAHPSIPHEAGSDLQHKITFTNASDMPGPKGAFVIGAKSDTTGASLDWAKVAPANNITIKNLYIQSAAGAHANNMPVMILNASNNIDINNCNIEHLPAGASTIGGPYSVFIRGASNTGITGGINKQMPVNVAITNSIIKNQNSNTGQAIGVTADEAPTTLASGIRIENNEIYGRNGGIVLNYIENITALPVSPVPARAPGDIGTVITKNKFYISQGTTGYNSFGIYGMSGLTGSVEVTKNRFLKLETADTSPNNGITGILVDGGSPWYIDNNFITGFENLSAGGMPWIRGMRLNVNSQYNIRHNTFYMKSLAQKPTLKIDPSDNDDAYCAISRGPAVSNDNFKLKNNLFVSDESTTSNFFFLGHTPELAAYGEGSPATGDCSVFCFPLTNSWISPTMKSVLNTRTFTSSPTLRVTTTVNFVNTATGDLTLTSPAASPEETDLGMARLPEITDDIVGNPRNNPRAYAGAFEISSTNLITDMNLTSVNGVRVTCLGNQISVFSGDKIQSVRLYDLQGRILSTEQNATSFCSLAAPGKGVYIVETTTANSRDVQKVAVK